MAGLLRLLVSDIRTRVTIALKRRALRMCEANISYFELQQVDAQHAVRHLHRQRLTLEHQLKTLEGNRP